jgi:hypothetical protein
MKRHKQSSHLSWGEYILLDQSENTETANRQAPGKGSSDPHSKARPHLQRVRRPRSAFAPWRSAPAPAFSCGQTSRRGGGLPSCRACVRSTMRLRSNSANTPTVCHMARPVGVVVSIASVSEWNFTPRARRSSNMAIRSCKVRPNQSSFHTVAGWRDRREYAQSDSWLSSASYLGAALS